MGKGAQAKSSSPSQDSELDLGLPDLPDLTSFSGKGDPFLDLLLFPDSETRPEETSEVDRDPLDPDALNRWLDAELSQGDKLVRILRESEIAFADAPDGLTLTPLKCNS